VQRVRTRRAPGDFENPCYYNIRWLQQLEEKRKAAGISGSVLDAPPAPFGASMGSWRASSL
jgi:hypothetical protein